jgi:hypothetical protein
VNKREISSHEVKGKRGPPMGSRGNVGSMTCLAWMVLLAQGPICSGSGILRRSGRHLSRGNVAK